MPKDDIRITGRFGGHDVDVTIALNEESDTPTPPQAETVHDVPDPTPSTPPEGGQAPVAAIETQAEGEVIPAAKPDDAPEPSSDPAPPVTPVSDEAPNPAGNAEQL